MQWRKRRQRTDADTDTLSQLLEREQRVTRELDAAREDALRLRREATAYAAERDAACTVMIRERTALLASAHEAQLDADLRTIAANTVAQVRHFDERDTAQASRLVEIVLESIGARPARGAVPSA